MSEKIIAKGKILVPGKANGNALISKTPISFLGMINLETGNFDYPGHELDGKNIKDKILIYPHGKGSSGDTLRMFYTKITQQAPAALLFDRAESIHVQGAILMNIPTLYNFDKDIFDIIENDDIINIENDSVEIIKKS